MAKTVRIPSVFNNPNYLDRYFELMRVAAEAINGK